MLMTASKKRNDSSERTVFIVNACACFAAVSCATKAVPHISAAKSGKSVCLALSRVLFIFNPSFNRRKVVASRVGRREQGTF